MIRYHLQEDEIEAYSLGRMEGTEHARIEEHLLVCSACQERIEASDLFVGAMRDAAQHFRQVPERANRWTPIPRLAFGVAAALLLIAIAGFLAPKRMRPAVAISLMAMRGDVTGAKAPAGTPLDLRLDTTGLSSTGPYQAEMVDATGKTIWRGNYPGDPAPGIGPGFYFIRLYTDSGELLREYGLQAVAAKQAQPGTAQYR